VPGYLIWFGPGKQYARTSARTAGEALARIQARHPDRKVELVGIRVHEVLAEGGIAQHVYRMRDGRRISLNSNRPGRIRREPLLFPPVPAAPRTSVA
jgi:hypothetical protein